MRSVVRSFVALSVGAVVVSGVAASGAGATSRHHRPSGPTVVTRGLDNPRQLDLVAGGGALLIAEAGRGGTDCVGAPPNQMCVGATGAISAVLAPQFGSDRRAVEIVRGLLSGAGPDGSFAVGSDGVSAYKPTDIKIIETFAPPDVLPAGLPGEQSGKLLRARPFGAPKVFADITAFEQANDPDGQGFDSNPYSVLARRGRTLVSDAAGNSILSVNDEGEVSLFAVLPNITTGDCADRENDGGTIGCDFVPTSLAEGRHGSIYVGGLAAEEPGAGTVVKLDAETGEELQRWTGLTTVTGVAVGRDGSVYASEFSGGSDPNAAFPGQVTRIARDGSRKSTAVPFPAGVVVDHSGNVFVSAFSVAPGTGMVPNQDTSGQVWRFRF